MNLFKQCRRWTGIALAAASVAVAAQDPLSVGPGIYTKVMENERVRLMQVEFAPGASIGMHSHPDHAAYVLAGGTLNVTGADGKTQVFQLKTGEAVWLPAQSHSASNPGKKPLRVLVVELKEPATAQ